MSTEGLPTYDSFVDGATIAPSSGERFESFDPTTGKAWALVGQSAAKDVDLAVEAAAKAFRGSDWRSMPASQRGLLLFRLADAIYDSAEQIAELETRENGKLYREMVTQLKLVPNWLRYYGGLADKIEGRTIPLDKRSVLNYTVPEPLGVVGVISPWNSPVFLAMMATAPAIAAGNTVVVKPSEVTSLSMLEVARLAVEVGFPPGVLNVVTGAGTAGQALVDHPDVAKLALTGGTESGRAVAIGAAKRLARTTLELGGKSANIVFADADLEAAEAGLLAGIFAAAGQTCVAGSRALIHESVFDQLVERVAERAERIKLGNPMDEATEVGPLATLGQLDKVADFVARAKDEGAEVVAGGRPAELDDMPGGYFYRPTVVSKVGRESHLFRNEVFGPVLAAIPFSSQAEAVEIANDSRYGLAAGVWSQNIGQAIKTADALEAGTVWINTYRAMAPQSPFGGYKESGIGRQNGQEAISEYVQTKSVWVETENEAQDPFILRS